MAKIDHSLQMAVTESEAQFRHQEKYVHESFLQGNSKQQAEDYEIVQAKGAICLSIRNLWDDFLHALGELDPNRSKNNYEFRDEDRLQFAKSWVESKVVESALLDAVKLLREIGPIESDPYFDSVSSKLAKLQQSLRS